MVKISHLGDYRAYRYIYTLGHSPFLGAGVSPSDCARVSAITLAATISSPVTFIKQITNE
jgi:hypothetical protein